MAKTKRGQNTCIVCESPITGRRRKCDDCKTTCPTCYTPMRLLPGGPWYCPPCRAKTGKRQYEKHGEKIRAKDAAKRYGLSVEEVYALRQQDACDVCGGKSPNGRSLHIDHDHRTGVVRGLLCHGCNLALGNVDDNPDRLRALATYLEESK